LGAFTRRPLSLSRTATSSATTEQFGSNSSTNTSCENIEEAQDHATQWLCVYNNDRPDMGIGAITPALKLKMAA
jgi:transposase InsO family protein